MQRQFDFYIHNVQFIQWTIMHPLDESFLEVSTASSLVEPISRVHIHLQHLHHPLVSSRSVYELIQWELTYVPKDSCSIQTHFYLKPKCLNLTKSSFFCQNIPNPVQQTNNTQKTVKVCKSYQKPLPSPFSSTNSNIRSTTWSGVSRLHSSSSSPWQAFFSR